MAWTAIANWPGASRGAAWAVGSPALNGKLYTGGGDDGLGTASTEAHVYDPATNTWSAIASMNVARTQHPFAVWAAGKLYVGGGQGPTVGTNLASVEVYDPAANTWTNLSPMGLTPVRPGAAYHAGTGAIYVFMGDVGGTRVLKYVIATDTWSSLVMAGSTPRTDAVAVTIGDTIYVTGDTRLMAFDVLTLTFSGSVYADLTAAPVTNSNTSLGLVDGKVYVWGSTTVTGSDTYQVTPPAVPGWTALGDSAPQTVNSSNTAATGNALYLIPMKGIGVTKTAYRTDITVLPTPPNAVLGDVGEFRLHPRWPQMARQWGYTEEEAGSAADWAKVDALFDYDESTGTFRRKGGA